MKEQVRRLVNKIHEAFEPKKYGTATFLDISQAFDCVGHDGLLCKVEAILPTNDFIFIKFHPEEEINNRAHVLKSKNLEMVAPLGAFHAWLVRVS